MHKKNRIRLDDTESYGDTPLKFHLIRWAHVLSWKIIQQLGKLFRSEVIHFFKNEP